MYSSVLYFLFAVPIEISTAFVALFVLVAATLLCLTVALVFLARRCNEPHSRSSACAGHLSYCPSLLLVVFLPACLRVHCEPYCTVSVL